MSEYRLKGPWTVVEKVIPEDWGYTPERREIMVVSERDMREGLFRGDHEAISMVVDVVSVEKEGYNSSPKDIQRFVERYAKARAIATAIKDKLNNTLEELK